MNPEDMAHETLFETLEAAEWSGNGYCPDCGRHKGDGHAEDCGMARALSKQNRERWDRAGAVWAALREGRKAE